MKRNLSFLLLILSTAAAISASPAFAQTVEIGVANAGISEPVANMKSGLTAGGPLHIKPLRPTHSNTAGGAADTVVQSSPITSSAAVMMNLNFEGLGNGFPGFLVNSAPPDPNGVVGATQYVQWVNESFEVFNKTTGASVAGPISGRQVFQGLGATHPCAVNNDGDPVAQYDKANARWVLSQLSVTNGSVNGYFQCVAVSQTSDATGAYNAYAFPQPNFNDYPKLSVWSNGYYATYNIFSGNTFVGPRLCAMDGAAMRAGAAAAQQCVQLPNTFDSVLPSDLDGTIAPPPGTDLYAIAIGTNMLDVWRYHVDFANPANSVLSGPTITAVAPFRQACNGGTCVLQPGTNQKLDSLGDRVMYRFAYRHFADGHEALVANHSVNPGAPAAAAGVRWYELRPDAVNGGLTLFQQGTYAPADGVSRWMGSIAQDKVGNIVVGYSASGTTLFPSIRIATRTAGDPAGTLGNETTIMAGAGSQTRKLSRWGDYSALTVDPADDCTFWYTNEYLAENGMTNWHTRIASFKLTNCI